MSKKTDQISVRLSSETMEILREIDTRHGLIPTEFTRRLIESAVDFYRKNGWFGFPVEIYPRSYQQAAEPPPSQLYTQKKNPDRRAR